MNNVTSNNKNSDSIGDAPFICCNSVEQIKIAIIYLQSFGELALQHMKIWDTDKNINPELRDGLEEALLKGEQVLELLNKEQNAQECDTTKAQ